MTIKASGTMPNTPPPSSPQTPPALDGALWTLDTYRNSNGEIVTVIPSTAITSVFADGQISGIAGCNNCFASYEAKGEAPTFGAADRTEMWCADPDGLMDQESAFLRLLASVAGTRVAVTLDICARQRYADLRNDRDFFPLSRN